IKQRLQSLLTIITNEQKVLDLEHKIGKRVQTSMEKTQKEYYLREQMKAIQKELEGGEGKLSETDQLRKDIIDREMPEKVTEIAMKELDRYERIPQSSAESNVIRNYLDWLIDFPWREETKDAINIDKAEAILDQDHYGLDKVKERILESLTVQILTNAIKSPIIRLLVRPGVNTTSINNSTARSIGRNFERISLGAIQDEAEIRGNRRSYIGAMPARIIQGMKNAGTINPII